MIADSKFNFKKTIATVAISFGIYMLNGLAIQPTQASTYESIQVSNRDSASLQ